MTRTVRTVVVAALTTALVIFAGVALTGPASAKPRAANPVAAADVDGTLADGTGVVDGTFDVTRFAVQDGELTAIGTFTGSVTNAAGDVVSGSQQIALPVDTAASNGSCQILDLVLGPLDLDLLGLQVSLDTVHLNITAQQGPGNLLGNLLCAVANLLNGGLNLSGVLGQIATLLNQILGVLSGLGL